MKIWSVIPWYLKYPAILVYFIWKAPLAIQAAYDNRWYYLANPLIEKRELQAKHTEQRLLSMDRKLDILIERSE